MDNAVNVFHHALFAVDLMDQHAQDALMAIMQTMANAQSVILHVQHAVDQALIAFHALLAHILMEIHVLIVQQIAMNATMVKHAINAPKDTY